MSEPEDDMETATLEQIEEQLRRQPPELLAVVLDFVSYLSQQEHTDARYALVAAVSALRKDWDRPEEDAAWSNL